MNLIILHPGELDGHGAVTLSDHRASHLLRVLNVAPGDEVRVGVLDGPLGTAAVLAIGDNLVTLRCRLDAAPPPRPAVDLLLALPRPKVMRRLWAQVAALGVDRIVLTNASRVERQYFDTHLLTPEAFTPLLIEGLQQAKDTRLPRVSIHKRFKVLLEDDLDSLSPDTVRLSAEPSVPQSAAGVLADSDTARRVLLAIGPEGGWNGFERSLLAAHRFEPFGIGPRTLRTDTACVALLAIVHQAIAAHRRP